MKNKLLILTMALFSAFAFSSCESTKDAADSAFSALKNVASVKAGVDKDELMAGGEARVAGYGIRVEVSIVTPEDEAYEIDGDPAFEYDGSNPDAESGKDVVVETNT